MAHTIYYLDASYWSVSSGSLKTYGMVSFETHAYILNPEAHNTNGFNKDKANMTKAEFNAYLTTLTAGETSIPNASDYTLANWTSRGWGSSAADVLQNYNKFIENNFLNGTSNRAINAANRDLTTLVVSGTIGGTTYFLPLAIYGGQGEAAVTQPTAPSYFSDSNSILWFKPDDITAGLHSVYNLEDNSSGKNTPVTKESPNADGQISGYELNGYKGIGRTNSQNQTMRWRIIQPAEDSGVYHTYIIVASFHPITGSVGQAQMGFNTQYINSSPSYEEIRYSSNPSIFGGGSALQLGTGSFGFNSTVNDTVANTLPSAVIYVAEFNYTRIRLWRNGTAAGNHGSSVSATGMDDPVFRIKDVTLHELCVMKTALTDSDREAAETYLAKKYNLQSRLPVGHPGK